MGTVREEGRKMGWLNCTVKKGQFTGEYAVKGKLFNSEEFSMFAPANFVRITEEPTEGEVNGRIMVNILEEEKELVLVSLPQPTFENGQTITVQKDQVIFA